MRYENVSVLFGKGSVMFTPFGRDFASLGIAQASLALLSLIAKIRISFVYLS